jgi:hypothetical protein
MALICGSYCAYIARRDSFRALVCGVRIRRARAPARAKHSAIALSMCALTLQSTQINIMAKLCVVDRDLRWLWHRVRCRGPHPDRIAAEMRGRRALHFGRVLVGID